MFNTTNFSDCNLRADVQRSIFFALCSALLLVAGFNTPVEASASDTHSLIKTEAHTADADTSKVYRVVDQMPKIVGGVQAIYENISYPSAARRSGIEGRVFITFIVDEKGNVQQPKILRDIGGGCGDAAIAAIQEVKFTPGLKGGKAVKVQYSLPITFKLR